MSSGYFGIDPETEKRLARAVKFADFSNHNDFIFAAMVEKIERCEQDMPPEMLGKPKAPAPSVEPVQDAESPKPVLPVVRPNGAPRLAAAFGDMLAKADAGGDLAAPAEACPYLMAEPERKRPVPSSVELEAVQRAALAAISPSFEGEARLAAEAGKEPVHPANVRRNWRGVAYRGGAAH